MYNKNILQLFYDDVYCHFLEGNKHHLGNNLKDIVKDFYSKFYIIGFTINLPRVKTFVKASSRDQQRILKLGISDALKKIEKDFCTQYIVKYELCTDLNTHCHGIIYFSKDIPKMSIAGFLRDIHDNLEKVFNKALRRNNVNNEKYKYFSQYQRVRTNMITLQFMNSEKEFERWVYYMYKEQTDDCQLGSSFVVSSGGKTTVDD